MSDLQIGHQVQTGINRFHFSNFSVKRIDYKEYETTKYFIEIHQY